jgi:hypothetical protein
MDLIYIYIYIKDSIVDPADASSCMHSHGAQGVFDNASKASLENEFGTSKDDECLRQILERGEIQETTVRNVNLRLLPANCDIVL